MPFADATFDNVLSTFGVMFTPNQERAAAELLRVCRPGGRIGLTNWTPHGFIGQMFKVIGRYAPPPAGVRSPLEWGAEVRLSELFGNDVQALDLRRREFVFRYRSAEHWLDTFRTYYGPTFKVVGALGADEGLALEHDLLTLARTHNSSSTGTLRVASEYVEVVAVRAK